MIPTHIQRYVEITVSHWLNGPCSEKFSYLGQIHCTMGKPMKVNVPTVDEWPTNFKLLFQALHV